MNRTLTPNLGFNIIFQSTDPYAQEVKGVNQ
jgi:hypothetical protein